MAKQTKKAQLKKTKRNLVSGIAYIKSTFNNTLVTLTDENGDTLACSSAGANGFKGAKKGTPFAAQVAAEKVSRQGADLGIKQIQILVNGPGVGRETAVRAFQVSGMRVTLIKDITPLPHNGCRPPKKRRV